MARGAKKEAAAMVGYPQGPSVEEYCVKPSYDSDGVQVSSGIGLDGREYPDPVPMSPPIGYEPPSDLLQMLEQLFKRGKAVLEAAEIETEEEANDFDIPDDPVDLLTPYEKVFEPPVVKEPAVSPPAVVAPVAGEGGGQPTSAPPSPPAS